MYDTYVFGGVHLRRLHSAFLRSALYLCSMYGNEIVSNTIPSFHLRLTRRLTMHDRLLPINTMLFLCDIQEKMGIAINEFDSVVGTASKMTKIAKLFGIPVVLSEQHPAGLGPTATGLQSQVDNLGELHLGTFAKKAFGMLIPSVEAILTDPKYQNIKNIVLAGVETHICIVQTALDLTDRGYSVYVLADGVSSCNLQETRIALSELRHKGVTVASSESIMFRLLGDAADPKFKAFQAILKEEKLGTQTRLEKLNL